VIPGLALLIGLIAIIMGIDLFFAWRALRRDLHASRSLF